MNKCLPSVCGSLQIGPVIPVRGEGPSEAVLQAQRSKDCPASLSPLGVVRETAVSISVFRWTPLSRYTRTGVTDGFAPYLFLLALLGCSAPAMVQTPPPKLIADPTTCEGCHPAAVQEWRESQHAVAYTNSIFQSEFKPSKQVWCVSCHSPLAKDPFNVDDKDPLVAQGVSCAACHFPDGEMRSKQKKEGSPHQTKEDPNFGDASFCASCHEFNFPILGKKGVLERYTEHPMQATVTQYKKSGLADSVSCLDCHAATPGKHRFPGSHHLETLQSTLRVEVCRDGASLRAKITNKEAAHNVPSGGVHRFMVLRAWRSTSPEKMFEAYIGRKFKALDGGGKEMISDTTLAPREERMYQINTHSLGETTEALNIELRYVYALREQDRFPDIATTATIWFHRGSFEEIENCQ
jgi:hypothetical protein